VRADRLVATLLLLQARGRVTAAEVAEELEISVRTARRDLEALSMAGIPVYSQAGKGGGWRLIGGARTDLSGLTAAEARTLFMVAGPSAAATPEVKAALRKLSQALPETFRADAEAAASAIIIDPSSWDHTPPPPPPHLDVLQQAVVDGLQVRLGYSDRQRAITERTVHPLGLVAKGNIWYLIGDTEAGLRTFRVGRVRSVDVTDEPVVRPEGFDLAEAWQAVVEKMEEQRATYRAVVRSRRFALPWLRATFGTRAAVVDPVDSIAGRPSDGRPDDWLTVELRGYAARGMAGDLAGFGDYIEVVEPQEVRDELARVGADLVERYGRGVSGVPGASGASAALGQPAGRSVVV
jgi:predicted DNA-binding transcriptional regulator YafY